MQRLHTQWNFISKFEKPAKANFDNFYVLRYNFAKSGLNWDFLVSADSWDPEDFKTGLKKAKEGHMKAVRPLKVSIPNLSPHVRIHVRGNLWDF